jgi:phosphoribosylformimino-5-aminoimidazole carboxamide ribotide isomerase
MRRDEGLILYAAVDIRGGRAVRLSQGRMERQTVYYDDPVQAARHWADQGAPWLHVVDLDGAVKGRPVHLDLLPRITEAVDAPVQYGGGLRDISAAEAALAAGAERVVLGTAALRDPEFLSRMLEAHPDRTVVSVDARGDRVALSGWTEAGDSDPASAIAGLSDRGARRFVFTPIERDGMLEGPDLEALREAAASVRGELVYSGGVGEIGDLRALAGLDLPTLAGVIVGRALYERRFTVAAARKALSGTN